MPTITQLTALVQASVVPGTDVLPVVNGGATKKLTVQALVNAAAAALAPQGGTLALTGAMTVSTTLNVTGLSTLSTLAVTGVSSITANSANPALTVTQTGAGNALVVEDVASTDSTPFVIDGSGNVGIGGSPTKLLHLTSTDQSTLRMRLTNSGAGGRSWEVVGGLDGTNNSSFSIYDVTAAATRVNINSVGGFGFGIAAAADTSFYFGKDIDGATTAYGARFAQTINSAVVTTTGIGCISQNGTSGATTTVHQVRAEQGTFTGAVTNQMGFIAGSSLTGATNNYGFYSNIAAAANRWNFYAAGTAQNYFAGVTGIGVVPASTSNLTVAASTTAVSSLNIPHGSAPTSPVDGDMWTTTAGLFVRINGATVGPLS